MRPWLVPTMLLLATVAAAPMAAAQVGGAAVRYCEGTVDVMCYEQRWVCLGEVPGYPGSCYYGWGDVVCAVWVDGWCAPYDLGIECPYAVCRGLAALDSTGDVQPAALGGLRLSQE